MPQDVNLRMFNDGPRILVLTATTISRLPQSTTAGGRLGRQPAKTAMTFKGVGFSGPTVDFLYILGSRLARSEDSLALVPLSRN